MTSRRAYLAVVTGGLSALAGCQAFDRSEPSKPAETDPSPTSDGPDGEGDDTPSKLVPESSFGRVVDMVEDVGVDATGEEPVDEAFQSALGDDTLLVFPEGTYKMSRAHAITNYDRVGIVGRGNARIVPNDVWNGKLLDVAYMGEFLFSGFDVDIRNQNTTVGFRVACEDRFRIENIEFLGRGTHPNDDVIHAMNAGLVNEGGRGVIRGMVAEKGSAIDQYKNGGGRGGIYVGPWNAGTIDIEDCHLSEFGNNAIYASRTPGKVRVRGGTFFNNSPSSVRIGGRGSLVENAHIEVDLAKYTGPEIQSNNFKARGVVIEQKTTHPETVVPAGAVMRGCKLVFRENPTQGPAVVVWSNGKTLSIEDSEILVENNSPAVLREGIQKQGNNPPWEGERWIRITDTRITSSNGSYFPAVQLIDAPTSELRNCKIERVGANRAGVEFIRSGGGLIRGGSIHSSGYPILLDVDGREERCLVSFADQPSLEIIERDEGEDQSREVTLCTPTDDESTDTDESSSCCVTWDDIGRFVSEEASHVAVTGLDGEDVSLHSLQLSR